MTETKTPEIIIIGAGDRGKNYANHIKRVGGKIVGVAEPLDHFREQVARENEIKPENVFSDFRELAKREKFADAVVIATQDAMHTEPAVTFANLGYNVLLEKPMAPTAEECREIIAAVKKNDVLFGCCHVLRYTDYTQALKKAIDSGKIGEVISLEHLEPVGFWHQAHSFVRGNWGNEAKSSFMLLAKSCHDIDWIHYIMDEECKKVSSFGSLSHFRPENKPEGAADRCLDCKVDSDCPYSAKKFYLGRLREGNLDWPLRIITLDFTEEGVTKALREGPYGRCVYNCDNDVVDHQVVNMEFEKGKTATFTMTAFTTARGRETKIFGTKGEIIGDSDTITLNNFLTNETEIIETAAADSSILGGHGGGDGRLIEAFVAALQGDTGKILSGPDETLESHLITFASEQSRKEKRIVEM